MIRQQQGENWNKQSPRTQNVIDHVGGSEEGNDDHPVITNAKNEDLARIFQGFKFSNDLRPSITLPPFEEKNSEDEDFDIMKDYMQCMGRKIGGIQGQDMDGDDSNVEQQRQRNPV